ncbi:MAG TPA: ABC transporter permease [Pyrinomonadaceae bacterium]|nr:ABC transporter permease [Pyrinomonadaceae bacterium]
MGTLWQDIQYGFRTLRKEPGFTLVAVLALALGIGANTAIFSVVNSVLLRALPYEGSERLVTLYSGSNPTVPNPTGPLSYPDILDYRNQSQTLEYVAGYQGTGTVIQSGGDEPERVRGTDVMADIFPMLGVKPALGRVYTREEDSAGAPPFIVISDGLWRRRFGAAHDIVGREIKMGLSGRSVTILGVMPPGFKFPADATEAIDYYMPMVSESMRSDAESMNNRGAVFIPTVAKLKKGVTLEQAATEISTISSRLQSQYPDTNARRRVRVVSMHEDLVGNFRTALLVLLGAVGFVLLIACANVANLLLARAASRSKEIAIRTAMGATRGRVMRQLLTESLLLSFMGGALGLLLAMWSVDILIKLSPANVPLLGDTSLDSRVLLFTLIVSTATGIIFGLVPAIQTSRLDLAESLKEGGRSGSEGARRNRVRSILVVSEIALSLVLLIGAGLLMKSFYKLLNTNPGYSPERVLALTVALSQKKFPDDDSRAAFFTEAISRIKGLPGVETASATRLLPLGNSDIINSFNIVGRAPFAPSEYHNARSYTIGSDYFRVLSIPVRQGRVFTDADTKNSPSVILVNEAFARKFFPDQDPIGQRLTLDDDSNQPLPPREIVGIVGNIRFEKLDDEVQPEFYVPYTQSPSSSMQVIVRSTAPDAAVLTPSVRAAIKGVDSNMLIWETHTMDELVGRSVAPQRFNMLLLALFATVALILASVGIYGVMAYSVAQRTHEIGIRMALGAQRVDVLRMILSQGMMLALVGVCIGLIAAIAATRIMRTLLYEISPTDMTTFATVSLLLAGVALLACIIPARRATKVDPMVALRYE